MTIVMSVLLSTESVASPPPNGCGIRLAVWCMIRFDGTTELKDLPDEREWSLRDRIYFDRGPLVILEDKRCVSSDALQHAKQLAAGLTKRNGAELNFIRYRLNSACSLTFEWPSGSANDNIYRNYITQGIMVGASASVPLSSLP